MRVDSGIPVTGGSFVAGTSAGSQNTAGPEWPRESMPFTIRIARSEAEIQKAVQIRHAAYSRHVPTFAHRLRLAEEFDYEDGSVVLLAESKLDGSPLGTMRIQTNVCRDLSLEGTVELPNWLRGKRLAEATRLGISEGRVGRVVKLMLFKAYFRYCLAAGIDWMVICARSPLDRQYDALLFKDVFPGRGFVPMRHIGNIPHRVMAFEPISAEVRWAAAEHPLFNFIFRTSHPDIDVERANVTSRRASPRVEMPVGEYAYS